MLPKRKLIKKQFVAPETSLTEESGLVYAGDLIEQLKSGDPKVKADAISAIANIQSVSLDLQEQLFSTSTLIQLTSVLTTASAPSLIQTALFAINNLCVLQAANDKTGLIVKNLFAVGLDKALLGLDSTDPHLIKPILMLMGTMAEYVPSEYLYLIGGVQNSIIMNCSKYLQEKYSDLVMQFLIKSNAQVSAEVTPEQRTCIQILQRIAEADKLYRNRALASRLQVTMTGGKYKQCIDLFWANFQQFITDIDLEKEYKANFGTHPIGQSDLQKGEDEDDEDDEEEDGGLMGEQKSKNIKQKEEPMCKQSEQESSYNIFIDALQGIQVLLEFIVDQLEDEDNFSEDEEEEGEMEEEQAGEQRITPNQFDKSMFLATLQVSLNKVIQDLPKYASLSFVEGQNIIELILRFILALPRSFSSSKKAGDKIPESSLIAIVEEILIHEFKLEMKTHQIPEEVFIFNAKTALQIVLKYKLILNRNIYIELPYLKYEGAQKLNGVISICNKWRQFWISLLEIYAIFYNPEKIPNVTEKENKDIGGTLKRLIVEIPEVQLEEWRGQAIDTVFDVYSNENFDKIFMEYGFVDILTQVLKVSGGNSNLGAKSKKTNKFINAVVADIQRFIAYKKKMIGF